MRVLSLVVVSSLACATSTTSHTSAPPSMQNDDVHRELVAYYADMSRRDWAAYASHFWPNATITTTYAPAGESAPRVVVITVDEFVKQTPEGPDSQPIFEETMRGVEMRCGPSTSAPALCQAWATYDAKFGAPGALRTWSGVDAFTLVKHDGRWRIAALVFAPD